MRPAPLALLLLALPAPALAADREVSLELGSIASSDPQWDLFSDSPRLPTQGLRIGWPVHDRVALVAAWHRGAQGSTLGGEGTGQSDFVAAFSAHALALGAKADLELTPWFVPFATLQALGLLGTVRLDDDPDDDHNPNQLSHSAFAPGALAAAGLELRLPLHHDAFAAATSLDLGYALLGPLHYDTLGPLHLGGFTLHWGVGARF